LRRFRRENVDLRLQERVIEIGRRDGSRARALSNARRRSAQNLYLRTECRRARGPAVGAFVARSPRSPQRFSKAGTSFSTAPSRDGRALRRHARLQDSRPQAPSLSDNARPPYRQEASLSRTGRFGQLLTLFRMRSRGRRSASQLMRPRRILKSVALRNGGRRQDGIYTGIKTLMNRQLMGVTVSTASLLSPATAFAHFRRSRRGPPITITFQPARLTT
jgi:hypothetical protein